MLLNTVGSSKPHDMHSLSVNEKTISHNCIMGLNEPYRIQSGHVMGGPGVAWFVACLSEPVCACVTASIVFDNGPLCVVPAYPFTIADRQSKVHSVNSPYCPSNLM